MAIKERSALSQDTTANYIETISHDDCTAVANFKLLFSFTIASVAPDVSLHMNGFTILLSLPPRGVKQKAADTLGCLPPLLVISTLQCKSRRIFL